MKLIRNWAWLSLSITKRFIVGLEETRKWADTIPKVASDRELDFPGGQQDKDQARLETPFLEK